MMRQSGAIFLDAYREMNARKMFWISLIISGLVVSVLLLIGISDGNKFKVLWWETPFPIPPAMKLSDLLKGTFIALGIGIWLTWAATILALISTASIFPDFISSGSIDLLLSKPISRLRLFLLKYTSGLMFVALQVSAFSLVTFIVIGARTGDWEPGLFIAVPIVVIFFSYLYCVCTLLGIVTRSTIAALLLTLLFWLMLFGLNMVDAIMLMPRVANEVHVEKLHERVEAEKGKPEPNTQRVAFFTKQLAEAEIDRASIQRWHGLVVKAKTLFPKTDDTASLLERWLIESAHLPDTDEQEHEIPFVTPEMRTAGVRPNDVMERMDQAMRSRPVWWVLGTSLIFEALVLMIAAWIFSRRDF